MINARIVNNRPICAKCESENLSGIRDYKEVEMDDEKYVMFQVKCYNCNTDNRYLADVDIEETTRYAIKHTVIDVKDND